MKCPECKQPMSERDFEGREDTRVSIDVCPACGGLWFDIHESLQLSPEGTFQLFRAVQGLSRAVPRPRRRGPLTCPRCDEPLALADGHTHGQRFRSSRCPEQHGHFITFFQFLREKGFVRDLKPREREELRKHVDTLLCSDCGAPVRLDLLSACGRCQAPLSLLDPGCVDSLAREVQPPDGSRQNVTPEAAARLAVTHLGTKPFPTSPFAQVLVPAATLFSENSTEEVSGAGLLGVGIEVVVEAVFLVLDALLSS